MSKEILDAVDTLSVEVKDSIQNLKTEYQETIDQKLEGVYSKEEADEKLKKMDNKWDELEAKINAKLSSVDTPSDDEKKEERKELLRKALRNVAQGRDAGQEYHEHIKSLQIEGQKGLYTDANVEGGYLVQPSYSNQIIEKAVEISPVDQVASVYTTSGNSFEVPMEDGQASVSQTSERGTRSETTAPTFRNKVINVYEEYASIVLSLQMIEDSAFDIEAFVQRKAAEQFGKKRGTRFTTGTGVNEATGFTLATTGNGLTSVTNGSATVIDPDKLIFMVDQIKSPYQDRGAWMFDRKTRAHIRKLRSDSGAGAGTGNYLWDPMSLANDAPARLLGYQYFMNFDLDSPNSSDEFTSGDEPVWFADWQLFYAVVNKVNLSFLRDPYTSEGFVKMKFRQRYGGMPIQEEAAVKLSMTT